MIRLTTLFGGENLALKCLTLFDGVQKLHQSFPLFSMFGEMLYAFDHPDKHFVKQSHSFLHPCMRTIELLRAKKSFTVLIVRSDKQQFYFFDKFNIYMLNIQTSLEEGGGNEADDVDFNEAEGEEFVDTRSESVDTGLESDRDDDKSCQAIEAVLLKAYRVKRVRVRRVKSIAPPRKLSKPMTPQERKLLFLEIPTIQSQ